MEMVFHENEQWNGGYNLTYYLPLVAVTRTPDLLCLCSQPPSIQRFQCFVQEMMIYSIFLPLCIKLPCINPPKSHVPTSSRIASDNNKNTDQQLWRSIIRHKVLFKFRKNLYAVIIRASPTMSIRIKRSLDWSNTNVQGVRTCQRGCLWYWIFKFRWLPN